jgi:hypothetical protein
LLTRRLVPIIADLRRLARGRLGARLVHLTPQRDGLSRSPARRSAPLLGDGLSWLLAGGTRGGHALPFCTSRAGLRPPARHHQAGAWRPPTSMGRARLNARSERPRRSRSTPGRRTPT